MDATLEDLIRELWLRQRNSIVWTTKDGTKIPITKMSPEHLINTIKMLMREKEEEEMLENYDLDIIF